MSSINTVNFQAQWTPALSNYNFTQWTPCQKVLSLIASTLLFIPKTLFDFFGRYLIVPASEFSSNRIRGIEAMFFQVWTAPSMNEEEPEVASLRQNFTPHHLQVVTPDGAHLNGVFYQNRQAAGEDIPTIIVFNGNGDLSKFSGSAHQLLEDVTASSAPYNVVAFDYRGIGRSTGDPSAGGFIVDGASIYQCVENALHISPPNIHIYGMSLGAGVGAEVKALVAPQSGGKIVLDRAFTSLFEEIKMFVHKFALGFFAWIAACFTYLLGWELNTFEALDQIRDPKLIFNHVEDPIIPREVTGLAFHRTPLNEREEILSVSTLAPADHRAVNNHCINTCSLLSSQGTRMNEHIISFLIR